MKCQNIVTLLTDECSFSTYNKHCVVVSLQTSGADHTNSHKEPQQYDESSYTKPSPHLLEKFVIASQDAVQLTGRHACGRASADAFFEQ